MPFDVGCRFGEGSPCNVLKLGALGVLGGEIVH